ncbi:MAG: putative selenate reductase subunit YgfK [Actinomycetota bacterium]
MGDLMRPLPFAALMDWVLQESRAHGAVFGLGSDLFFVPSRTVRDPMGHAIATPIGPAAGPHTQLAPNIVTSYLAGARFIELKTVQVMDGDAIRAAVAKPCINAEDEGFNCEWSTELTVGQAFDEYVRAHLAIRVLAVELGLGDGDDVAYNASVGYDLEGISSPLIDGFIEGLRDASDTPVYRDAVAWLEANLDRFTRFGRADMERLTPHVCDSVTLSTLHGCPAGEIERIANHLLDKGLHTFVKANPTMLGYDAARGILDSLGYTHITFDDHHFRGDLQFDDAVPMFRRLTERAGAAGLVFGVKLSNTLPNDVTRGELPAEEMYMSGRALAPLTLSLAAKLSHAFDGRLPISYSGGADATNIAEILATGIQPVTVATTLLKPGGYARLTQLATLATEVMRDADGIDVAALDTLVARVLADARLHKRHREKVGSRKTDSPLALTDCFKAPCEHGGCPIEQQIPEYLTLVAEERYAEAFELIARDNTAPTITGVLCSQPCREHCTRLDYDTSIDIRGVKLAAAEAAQEAFIAAAVPAPLRPAARIAVIGAGPAGIAAALFLRRNGLDVEVFERADGPYGIVARIIPAFRITREQIDRDFRLALAAGLVFHFGCDPDYDLAELRTRFDHVIVATGSWGRGATPVRSGSEHVVDALDFLAATHGDGDAVAGRRVAVVGAGDVAMDCARTARRLPGVEHVTLVYRRTEPFMPAAQEDVNNVRAEGIEILELLAPVGYDGALLRCERTELGTYDAGGRRSTHGTGEFVDLAFDTVIGATGATIDAAPYHANRIASDERGHPLLGPDFEAEVSGGLRGVHVIGDGRLGPDTVVRAMADAKVAARAILTAHGLRPDFDRSPVAVFTPEQVLAGRRGVLRDPLAPPAEGSRCLRCDQVCEICTEVCPNRANVAVAVPGFADPRQIVHLDGLCNECGNCGTFCPHAGLPYRDKLTVFWTREDFAASTNTGFLPLDDGAAHLFRLPSGEVVTHRPGEDGLPEDLARVLAALEAEHPWYLMNLDELEGAAP